MRKMACSGKTLWSTAFNFCADGRSCPKGFSIDRGELIASARAAGGVVITVEDHYAHGGLGDAVLSSLAEEKIRAYKLAVRVIPHSGKAEELIEKFGISSGHIGSAVRSALG